MGSKLFTPQKTLAVRWIVTAVGLFFLVIVLYPTVGSANDDLHLPPPTFPEVVEFYRMSGDVDYLLRVVVPDIAAYDAFYKRLIEKIEIRDVSSAFAMEQIKSTTELPLDYMILDKEPRDV